MEDDHGEAASVPLVVKQEPASDEDRTAKHPLLASIRIVARTLTVKARQHERTRFATMKAAIEDAIEQMKACVIHKETQMQLLKLIQNDNATCRAELATRTKIRNELFDEAAILQAGTDKVRADIAEKQVRIRRLKYRLKRAKTTLEDKKTTKTQEAKLSVNGVEFSEFPKVDLSETLPRLIPVVERYISPIKSSNTEPSLSKRSINKNEQIESVDQVNGISKLNPPIDATLIDTNCSREEKWKKQAALLFNCSTHQ